VNVQSECGITWNRAMLVKLAVVQLVHKLLAVMVLEISLPCLQKQINSLSNTLCNPEFLVIHCIRKVTVHLGYSTYIWLSVSKLPLKCVVVWLCSVFKQRLKWKTGNVCNCLIQFLLITVGGQHFRHLL
jgi:hypothetical protein